MKILRSPSVMEKSSKVANCHPFFPLIAGNNLIYTGWEEGIPQMTLGEEATMTISRFVFYPLFPFRGLLSF